MRRTFYEYTTNKPEYDVIVVGGGAAGLGVSIALSHAGIEILLCLNDTLSVHLLPYGLRKQGS